MDAKGTEDPLDKLDPNGIGNSLVWVEEPDDDPWWAKIPPGPRCLFGVALKGEFGRGRLIPREDDGWEDCNLLYVGTGGNEVTGGSEILAKCCRRVLRGISIYISTV